MDYAWAAGIFEGEGCIYGGTQQGGKYPAPVVVVKMTDRDIVERLTEVLPFGSFYAIPKWEAGRKQPFQWRATGFTSLERFAEVIGPWLGERRTEKLNEVLAMKRVKEYGPDCASPSRGGRKRHYRRGEKACRRCSELANIENAEYRAKVRAMRVGGVAP